MLTDYLKNNDTTQHVIGQRLLHEAGITTRERGNEKYTLLEYFLSFPRSRGCRKSLTVGGAHPTFRGQYCELALLVGWALPTKLLLRHSLPRENASVVQQASDNTMLTCYKKMFFLILGFCLLGLCNSAALASERPVAFIDNLDLPFDPNPYVETIDDPNHEYTLEDIQTGKYDHLWQRNTAPYFFGRDSGNKYWFRLILRGQGDDIKHGVLLLANPATLLYELGFVITPHIGSSTEVFRMGISQPYSSRVLPSFFYGVPILLTADHPQIIIGWASNNETGMPVQLPFTLLSEADFLAANQVKNRILIAFYSVMMALLLYNSCLFATLRQPVYGLYLVFLINAISICAGIDGVADRWLWPNQPLTKIYVHNSTGILMPIAYLAFLLNALDGVRRWPLYFKLYRFFITLGFLALGYILFIGTIGQFVITTQIYSGLVMPFTLLIIVSALAKRLPTAGYLLIAEIMTLSGGTCFMLMIQGVIIMQPATLWSLHWGFAGEALLLSLAVAARTNIAIQEKLKAQELAYQNERKALAALETSTQIKNQFLTTVSHELRTPLNSIIGFSNVLLDNQQIKGADRDHAQTILNNGKQLLAVVNDVLNLSLIDSNRLVLTARVVDLRRLLQGLEAKYRLIAQKAGICFTLTLDKQLPHLIEIDDEHLTQILKQLLDNAFKFTHQGRVTLSATVIEQSFSFTLTDTGIGIPADKLAQIFEPFTQADNSNTRRYSGTGVGLFIAKSVCEKMGGALAVDSTAGVGTRIDLVLPMKVTEDCGEKIHAENQAHTTPEKPRLRGRVLYAEDNLDNQQLVKILVSTTGAEVTLVENGVAAIDAVNNAELPFDLVLMDLQMPEMDGYEATAMLKRNGCNTPVIACSASALAEIASTSDVVFAGYLGKPIDKMKLYAVLMKFLVAA